ncbi:MAG TPA: hypothetical protein VF649_06640 [Sphingomonas sp.]|jgi:hypothetical protein|uniref:hypothetical protein n=1 Tax=Sphingomonas sp. TaxID=28214 RepID=UPI002EDA8109
MTAATVDPVNHTASTLLARAFGPVPAGEEWRVRVRISNNGGGNDAFDLRIRKADGSNACYRARGHLVDLGGAPYDVETDLLLPAGYELWDRSGAGYVDASYTAAKRSV